ncbi:MAG: TRAP transporter large permease [Brevibacillus sp.]|nr:TRAP transporter large permease [Brevibacillus sp.]
MVGILGITLFSLLLIGFPIIMPLMASAIILLYMFMPSVNTSIFAQQLIQGIDSYVLVCIPMFIFAAEIMSKGQTADRLVNFVQAFIGHVRGGLAMTTVGACAAFGSISGSTQATVAAIGKPMRGRMLKAGYRDNDIMALIVNAADTAILIPPSSVMIMYGVITKVSIGDLFISGIVPGLLIVLLFSIYCYFDAKRKNVPVTEKARWAERRKATKEALLPFGFPVLILGGIYSGILSPVEASAASVLYALLLELYIFRSIKAADLYKLALNTGVVSGVVFLLVAAGQVFSWVLSYARIPQELTASLLGDNPSALLVLIVVNIVLFIGCMFVDSLVVITIVVPIFFPIAMQAGIDPIYLGVIVTMQAAIGAATPPFGADLFTATAVFNKRYVDIVKGTPPYILILLLIVVLMTAFPQLGMVYKYL